MTTRLSFFLALLSFSFYDDYHKKLLHLIHGCFQTRKIFFIGINKQNCVCETLHEITRMEATESQNKNCTYPMSPRKYVTCT